MIKAALNENNGLVKSETAPRMIGEIKYFAMNTPPSHCLACDGSAVSRTTYAALFAAIGTTWGAGDGSSTFNLPDLRGEWVQGAGTNAVGADIAEGLPNVIGSQSGDYHWRGAGGTSTAGGAFYFYNSTKTSIQIQSVTADTPADLYLDLSKGNPIYGASSHVTPKSKALKACIIYE